MTAALLPWPRAKFFVPGTNYPLAGGKVFTYQAGTSTPLGTFTDSSGSVANANPVILDANGEAAIYLGQDSFYKINVQDASGVQLQGYPVDNVYSADTAADTSVNVFAAKLASQTNAARGAALVGYTDPIAPTFLKTVSDIINGEPVSAFRFLTTAQIADIQSGAGSIDISTPLNNAIASLGASGRAGKLIVNGGKWLVGSTIDFSTAAAVPVSLVGDGRSKTVFQRAPAFTAGDMFFLGAITNPFSAWGEIKDLSILNSGGVLNTSGYAIHIQNRTCVALENVFIYEGFGGVWVDGSSGTISLSDVLYLQSTTYATNIGQSEAGYKQIGVCSSITMTDCQFIAENVTTPNCLLYGAYFGGSDGFQSENCSFNGQDAIRFAAGSGFNIDDMYFANTIIDSVRNNAVNFQGLNGASHVYTNIRFLGAHINARVDSGLNTIGVVIAGDCDNIQFIGGNINLAGGTGVSITGIDNWTGNPRQSIKFNGVDITGNNVNSTNAANAVLDVGVTGVSFVDCDMFNRVGSAGAATYALALQGSNSGIKIIGSALAPNTTGRIFYGGTGYTNMVISDNPGHNNVVDTLASASTINALPVGDMVNITGTTTIDTINGGWVDRSILFYSSSGPVTFSAAGNIAVAKTVANNEGIQLTYDGAKWRSSR